MEDPNPLEKFTLSYLLNEPDGSYSDEEDY